MDEQKTLNEEYGLGPEWTPVENVAPINPSRPQSTLTTRITDRYLAGSISPSLQHDAYFVQSGYVTPSVVSSPLMPVALAGAPANNAGVQQTIKTISVTTTTPVGGSTTAVQFNNGGAFGGDTGFTYDSITHSVFVAGDFTVGGNFVIGGGILITGNVSVTGYVNSTVGFRQGGAAASGHYLRGDGTNFISAVLSGSDVLAGLVGVTYGGTGANLSATGGAGQVLKQSSAGAAITVATLSSSDIPNLDASKITTGQLALARGGTHADLSATGGASFVLRQSSVGADVTVSQLAASDLSNGTNGSGAVVLTPQTIVDVTPVSVNANTTADQNLMSATVNANALNSVNRVMHLWCAGLYDDIAGVTTITFKVKLGSVTLITFTTDNPPAITGADWDMDCWLVVQTAGSSAMLECHGILFFDIGAPGAKPNNVYDDQNAATLGPIDLTTNETLQITIAFDSADTSNVGYQRQMIGQIFN